MQPVLRGYQTDLTGRATDAWNRDIHVVMGSCATGSGKCLGVDTPVLMYDGTIKKVQHVNVGDRLMGPDSKPRTVRSLACGREMLYAVIPTKGDTYVVNESHILSLKNTLSGEVCNVSVSDYLGQHKTFKHVHKGWRSGVLFPTASQDSDLTPYMLGLWLGDGASKHPAITTADFEIVDYLRSEAARLGLSVRQERAGGISNTYHLTTGKKRGHNRLRVALYRAGVLGNKHIPHNYLCADRLQRLQLLAGILDSDGHLHAGSYDLISKWKHLAEQIAYLARSLGFAAYVRECQKSAHPGHIGTYWRLSISGEMVDVPCIVARQKPAPRLQKKDVLRVGVRVEPIGVGDYYGFDISGDRLFMLGDFTVTHNTVMMGELAVNHNDYGIGIAHRGQLVTQLCGAFARRGIYHNIIGPKQLIKTVVDAQMEDFGKSFYNPGAYWNIASSKTLLNRADQLRHLTGRVTRGFVDEGHHCLWENEWGRAMRMFTHPDCRWWLPSATPGRADGKGLGTKELGGSGLVEELHLGPPMRELIDDGYLTDYIVRSPIPSDLDMTDVEVGSGGEYNQRQAVRAVKRSKKIIGSVADTYIKYTPGKLGVVFAVDVEHGLSLTAEFIRRGVPAEFIDADTPEETRRKIMRRYNSKETLILVNVDLFGEGFDLPAIEVVMMVRPTASFALYAQQWGRALRLLISPLLMTAWDTYTPFQRKLFIAQSEKPVAFIHDHVGNMLHFRGPPDRRTEWTLADSSSRNSTPSDAIPLRVCVNEICMQPYERFYPACPYCGMEPPLPEARTPEAVDGDLTLYTPQMLIEMFGVSTVEAAIAKSNSAFVPIRPGASQGEIRNQHANAQARLAAQAKLRPLIEVTQPVGRDQRINERKFFHEFGVDVVAARFLNAKQTQELSEKIIDKLSKKR